MSDKILLLDSTMYTSKPIGQDNHETTHHLFSIRNNKKIEINQEAPKWRNMESVIGELLSLNKFVIKKKASIRGSILCYLGHKVNNDIQIDHSIKIYFKRSERVATLCAHNITILCRKRIARNR